MFSSKIMKGPLKHLKFSTVISFILNVLQVKTKKKPCYSSRGFPFSNLDFAFLFYKFNYFYGPLSFVTGFPSCLLKGLGGQVYNEKALVFAS